MHRNDQICVEKLILNNLYHVKQGDYTRTISSPSGHSQEFVYIFVEVHVRPLKIKLQTNVRTQFTPPAINA